MSVVDERGALDRPVSLFEHARRLSRLHPGVPLPDGGRPWPDGDDPPHVPFSERVPALVAVLREFLDDLDLTAVDLHDRCAHLPVSTWEVTRAVREVASEPSQRLRATARWLVGNGWDRCAVLVGLGLLCGHADQQDVPTVRTVGLLWFADQLAARVLARVPGAARDLIWLTDRSRPALRTFAVRALADDPDPDVREWVLSTPRHLLPRRLARQFAERHGLAAALNQPTSDDSTWDQAGNLLLAMTSTCDYDDGLARYPDAAAVYQRWVALADKRPPTVDRAALLTTAVQDLGTGQAAPVVGDLRRHLIDQIHRVVSSPPWAAVLRRQAGSDDPIAARRAAWVSDEATRSDIPAERFAVRVVVPDPEPVGCPRVEARIIIDGIPVVAAAFDRGPAESPEDLLHNGRLRATTEPREVRLAEAYCSEGCCGGLYVTIVREGPEVVWKNWRSSTPGDPPQQVRFDAADYDREVTRAEQDHTWEWPARTLARLVADQLRADPTILGRWDCAAGWCTARPADVDTARLTFSHPAHTSSYTDPWVQFGLLVDVRGQSPDTLAAQIIESMRTTDPKTTAEVIGGSKDGPDKLGLVYRTPNRW